MQTKEFDIDEQLSALWQGTYNAIIDIIDSFFIRGSIIKLSNSHLLKYVKVSCDGVISLCSTAELIDYAEEFEDCYLYEAYRELKRQAQY